MTSAVPESSALSQEALHSAALSRARADFDAMGGANYRDETVKAMEGARDLTRAREHALECAREKETDGETKKTSEKESDPCCDSKRNSQTREKERKAIEPSHKIFSQPTIENEVDDAREKSRKEEKARWAHASGVAHLTARKYTHMANQRKIGMHQLNLQVEKKVERARASAEAALKSAIKQRSAPFGVVFQARKKGWSAVIQADQIQKRVVLYDAEKDLHRTAQDISKTHAAAAGGQCGEQTEDVCEICV